MKTTDLGNNETVCRGLDSWTDKNGVRHHTGLTFTKARTFKSKTAAIRWLHKQGIDINGIRIN